ncbi:hypothetical protein ACLKA6_019805 [Drosophila palustris]
MFNLPLASSVTTASSIFPNALQAVQVVLMEKYKCSSVKESQISGDGEIDATEIDNHISYNLNDYKQILTFDIGRQGIRCPTAQDRPYVVKNHILHEVPLLPTKYGGSREDNSNKTRNLRCYSNRA